MPRGRPKQAATASPAEQSNGQPESKMEGVRRAMAALGSDAKPLVIQDYLKKNFKIDMSTTVISSYKTTIAAQAKKKRGAKGGREPAAAQTVAAAPTGGGISLEDIAAVKRLCDQIGAEKVRQLAQVLG